MTNHSKHFRKQLLVMVAVFLGATLLLMGLVPPQEAQSKEKKNDAAQSSQEEQTTAAENVTQSEEQEEAEKTTPAEDEAQSQDQEEGEKTTPAESDEAQNKWVLDKDPEGQEYVAGELLVTYKKDASKQAKEEAPKKVGGKVEKDFPEIEVQHVSVPEVKNEKAQEARQKALKQKKEDLEQAPDVEAIDYNYVRRGTMVPSDPRYGEQWGFPKINAPHAWHTTQGSAGIRVAILDTGINMTHEDLTGKVVAQWNFVGNNADATDDRGHGTHVAGTVAAHTNNKDASGKYVGVAGTCPNCSLINAKVLNANNLGDDARYVSAVNWSVGKSANVINMSFAERAWSSALETAVNNARDKGVVVVASAGNKGTDIYPAAYESVIAVAATDRNDARATFDDPKTTDVVEKSNTGAYVDVAAPGTGILSAIPSGYSSYSGTSMAAPHVSGLAGLILSQNRSLSPTQVRNQIEYTAKDLLPAGKDNEFGHGRIDARYALDFFNRTRQENDPSITYSAGDWTKYSWNEASGGYTNWASRYRANAKLSFYGNSVSWRANRGPYGGRAWVYVDGRYADYIDLYADSNQPSRAVFTANWGAANGEHTIEIWVDGTSGRPWVDVDAFTVTEMNSQWFGW